LKESLEKVISTSGENAVWNKDTNTVYYNPKILKHSLVDKTGFGYGNKNGKIKGTTIMHNPLSCDLFKAIEEAKKNGFDSPLVIPLHI